MSTTAATGTINVLHVDDEPDFAEMAATFLEREDDRMAVRTATGAEEGLAVVADHEVDCIVSDYDMPGRNGIEFLEAVREEHPDLPFLLFTGKGSEAVASEAISAGVTDYLQKEGGTDQYAILANRVANAVDRTRAEREVRRTREYFGTILEHASDYVMIVNQEGAVEYISPAVERVMGYTPEELAGIDAFEPIHPEDMSVAMEAFSEVLEHPGEEHSVEYRARHADGSWLWLEVRGRNLLADPVIEGILVSARDITDRKEREEELERQNEHLDQFASVVSHDLRNPLTLAEGRLELAREECDSDHLDAIGNALDRMGSIIEDVLWLAREGRAIRSTDPVHLRKAIETAWTIVTDDVDGAELIVADQGGLRTVAADHDRLCQLLENVFRNAVEHGSTSPPASGEDAVEHGSTGNRTPSDDAAEHGSTSSQSPTDDAVEHGGERVTVTVGELDGGFYIEDDGPGIPADERDDVFEVGYSTSADGTGFGLNIVRRIAEAHGWEVRVTEGSGGGARFEITGVEDA